MAEIAVRANHVNMNRNASAGNKKSFWQRVKAYWMDAFRVYGEMMYKRDMAVNYEEVHYEK